MILWKYFATTVANPKYGWEKLSGLSIAATMAQARLFYPLLAMLAVSAFAGLFYGTLSLSGVIQTAIIQFSSYFFSYLAATFCLSGYFLDNDGQNRLGVLLAIAFSFLALVKIAANLTSGFELVLIANLYVVVLVVTGLGYLGVEERKKSFAVAASAICLVLPFAIEMLLKALLPSV